MSYNNNVNILIVSTISCNLVCSRIHFAVVVCLLLARSLSNIDNLLERSVLQENFTHTIIAL